MSIKETPVFVQTNDAASNQVVVFSRGEDEAACVGRDLRHRWARRRLTAPAVARVRSSPPTGESWWSTQGATTSPRLRDRAGMDWRSSTRRLRVRRRGVSLAHGDLVYVVGAGGLAGLA